MVVGHERRYQNRIVTRPDAFDPKNNDSRIPGPDAGETRNERLSLDRELYWFMIKLRPPFTSENKCIAAPGFTFSNKERAALASAAKTGNNESGNDDEGPIEDILNLEVRTRGTGDLRTHDGTPVINLPHRATPEYTVPSANGRPLTREQMKTMDSFRTLPENALVGHQDDIIFVRLPGLPTESDNIMKRAIYLLFDWAALNKISDEQFSQIFTENQDMIHVTDAEIGSEPHPEILEIYLEVTERVLGLM